MSLAAPLPKIGERYGHWTVTDNQQRIWKASVLASKCICDCGTERTVANYEPQNCRWATMEEQNNNKRTNRIISYKGESQSLTMWARKVGITPAALRWRIESGWSIDRALSEPMHTRHRGQDNG